jgi:capsular exopolysaccharide synthesis family protein
LFTSALPQEGKTFCTLNYAASLAQQGLRTVLIDGDLRRPAVEEALGAKGKRGVGVTDYLTGHKKFDEIIQSTSVENFSFIAAGTTAPNPSELLAKRGIDPVIEEALQHFDRVVVDSAPIHAVSDTLLMLRPIQTVCLVVRACKTPRKAVLRSIQVLQNGNAPLAGVIFNRLPHKRRFGSYYDHYYDYSYKGKYAEKGVYGT